MIAKCAGIWYTFTMRSFVSGGGRLSAELLAFYGSEITYSLAMKLIRKKDVKVNGKRVSGDVATAPGDGIDVYFDGLKTPINVLYVDENIIICHKPIKTSAEDFYEKVRAEYPSAGFIHRLDTNTDGLTVFSLGERAEKSLKDGFKSRAFEKYYLAEVFGSFDKREGVLTAYLKKDASSSTVTVSDKPFPRAGKIITSYRTVSESGGTSILEVGLVTGKTHQIRAHLAFAGHFVIGDGKYGKESVNRKYKANTQRLTAYRLVFHFKKDDPLAYLDGKEFVDGFAGRVKAKLTSL